MIIIKKDRAEWLKARKEDAKRDKGHPGAELKKEVWKAIKIFIVVEKGAPRAVVGIEGNKGNETKSRDSA